MCVVTLHVFLHPIIKASSFQFSYIFFYASEVAIPLFFMTNGYLIMGKKRTVKYCVNKIWNIVRLVLICNSIIYFCKIIMTHDLGSPLLIVKALFLNCFLQQGYFSVFWFFGSLIILYTLVPTIQKFLIPNKKYLVTVIICLIIIQFFIYTANIRYSILNDSQCTFESIYIPQAFRFYDFMTFYLIGAYIRNYGFVQVKLGGVIIGTSFFVTYLICMCWEVLPRWGVEYTQCSFFLVLYVSYIFCFLLNIHLSTIIKRIICIFSPAILMVYIIHVTVIYEVLSFMTRWVKLEDSYLFLCWLLILFISFMLSAVLMKIPFAKRIIKV